MLIRSNVLLDRSNIINSYLYRSHWEFSSYHSFLDNRKTKIKRNEVLQWFDGMDNFKYLHELPLNEKFILEMGVY